MVINNFRLKKEGSLLIGPVGAKGVRIHPFYLITQFLCSEKVKFPWFDLQEALCIIREKVYTNADTEIIHCLGQM